MAEKGWRLKRCGIASYGFERSAPGEYEYRVEFVGEKSYPKEKQYRAFLEDTGYRTLTKNVNLNYSFGKAVWWPWAQGTGQIATSPGSYNRELLIVEKKRDGKPFELHTDLQDRLSRYRFVLKAYFWNVALLLILLLVLLWAAGSASGFWLWAVRAAAAALLILYGIPAVKYCRSYRSLREESKTGG